MTVTTARAATPRESTARAVPGRRRRRRRHTSRAIGLAFLTPALLFYGIFVLAPWIRSLWFSFYDWDGIGPATWVGLDNYVEVFTNERLYGAFLHAFSFILFYTVIPVALGLVLAATLASRKRRGAPLLRTVLFLPQILPLVAVGVVWRLIYSEYGLLNQILGSVGLDSLTRTWLGDFTWAFPAVGLVGTWIGVGLCTILMLAGIQKVDPALYEAARLDGAGAFQEFRHVTLPSLRREITVATTVTLISAVASFDVVYVMTGGGPGDATTVPGVLIYQLVFTANRVGLACALGAVLSLVLIVLVAALQRFGKDDS